MNVLKFLQDKAGKVVFGAAQLGGTVAAAGLLSYAVMGVMGPSTNPAQNERIRSITSISDVRAPRESAIYVSGGGIASAQERAAIEGYGGGSPAVAYRGAGGSRARGTDYDYVEERAGNISLTAAVTSSTEGLGIGKNAAQEVGVSPAGPLAAATQGRAAANNAGQAAGQAAANASSGNKLASATMARSSGGQGRSYGGTYAPGSGSSVGTRASAAGSERPNTINPSFSGTMPGGSTTLISKATFGSQAVGGSRSGEVASGGRGAKERGELADIRKRSAQAAANENRSANEGARAFLANNKNSGGITTEDGSVMELGGGTSADFETPYMAQTKAANQSMEDVENNEIKREQHRTRIMRNMFALLGLTVVGMFAISSLMKGGLWSKIGAIAIGAALAVAIGFFIADATKYKNLYNNQGGFGIGGIIVGSVMLAMVAASFFSPVQKLLNKLMGKIAQKFGISLGGMAIGNAGNAISVVKDTAASAKGNGAEETETKG